MNHLPKIAAKQLEEIQPSQIKPCSPTEPNQMCGEEEEEGENDAINKLIRRRIQSFSSSVVSRAAPSRLEHPATRASKTNCQLRQN
jgi:hypothetical protein